MRVVQKGKYIGEFTQFTTLQHQPGMQNSFLINNTVHEKYLAFI